MSAATIDVCDHWINITGYTVNKAVKPALYILWLYDLITCLNFQYLHIWSKSKEEWKILLKLACHIL